MKILQLKRQELLDIGRWDIDYHLPPVGITSYSTSDLHPIYTMAELANSRRDPVNMDEEVFNYVDISCINPVSGKITQVQEVLTTEAPSRARKVMRAFDIIVSSCRPTRGAIAVVPPQLHNNICSTGFSIVRPNKEVNPYYLHFVLRLESTKEQFRKFSTGSSYPAILDSDVAKTVVPIVPLTLQNEIAGILLENDKIQNEKYNSILRESERNKMRILEKISDKHKSIQEIYSKSIDALSPWISTSTTENIHKILEELPSIVVDEKKLRKPR